MWDYAAGMQLLRWFFDAAVALDPEMRAHDEAVRFPISQEGRLAAAFEAADLVDVDHRPIDVPTVFRDFDDLWTPFLRGTGPAPAYVVSLDEPARRLCATGFAHRYPRRPTGLSGSQRGRGPCGVVDPPRCAGYPLTRPWPPLRPP